VGPRCLVAGQAMDVLNEGKAVSLETVDSIVKAKTGALIRASLTCGAALAGADADQIQVLGRYGDYLGVVFQIRDDLLDLEGDPKKLGKAVKKDRSRGKATYPTLLGTDQTRKMITSLVNSAVEAVEQLGDVAEPLILIARYAGERTS
jgi:geranylgeranyl diphosphate synthase, type II